MNKATKLKLRNFFKSFRNSLFFILVGMVMTLAFLNFASDAFKPGEYFNNIVSTAQFNSYVYSNLNDNYTVSVANFCSDFQYEEQAQCVISQVSFVYNYTMHNYTSKTPTEFSQTGGVCRDVAVTYSTIFKRLGWTTEFIYPHPEHVYIMVHNKDENNSTIDCEIDAEYYQCKRYNNLK
jgi:hypothetical protein